MNGESPCRHRGSPIPRAETLQHTATTDPGQHARAFHQDRHRAAAPGEQHPCEVLTHSTRNGATNRTKGISTIPVLAGLRCLYPRRHAAVNPPVTITHGHQPLPPPDAVPSPTKAVPSLRYAVPSLPSHQTSSGWTPPHPPNSIQPLHKPTPPTPHPIPELGIRLCSAPCSTEEELTSLAHELRAERPSQKGFCRALASQPLRPGRLKRLGSGRRAVYGSSVLALVSFRWSAVGVTARGQGSGIRCSRPARPARPPSACQWR